MAEINLAPGTEYMGLLRKRRRRVVGIAILTGVVISAIWGGLFVFQQQLVQEKRTLDTRLASVEAEITRLGDQGKRVTLFEDRLTAVDGLLTSHMTWDPFLKDLERLLPAPAVINNLKVTVEGSAIELSGTSPDLDVVAQTLASLVAQTDHPSLFTSSVLENVNRVEEKSPQGETLAVRYEFAAQLHFDPNQIRYGQ